MAKKIIILLLLLAVALGVEPPFNDSYYPYAISCRYGQISQYTKFHNGIDYGCLPGTPVLAYMDGIVVQTYWDNGGGSMISVQYDNGILANYAHNTFVVKEGGDYVKKGDVIALSGGTGLNSSGPHIHLELMREGEFVDPDTVMFCCGQLTANPDDVKLFKRMMNMPIK